MCTIIFYNCWGFFLVPYFVVKMLLFLLRKTPMRAQLLLLVIVLGGGMLPEGKISADGVKCYTCHKRSDEDTCKSKDDWKVNDDCVTCSMYITPKAVESRDCERMQSTIFNLECNQEVLKQQCNSRSDVSKLTPCWDRKLNESAGRASDEKLRSTDLEKTYKCFCKTDLCNADTPPEVPPVKDDTTEKPKGTGGSRPVQPCFGKFEVLFAVALYFYVKTNHFEN